MYCGCPILQFCSGIFPFSVRIKANLAKRLLLTFQMRFNDNFTWHSREIGFTNQIISSARLIFSKTKSKHFKMFYLLWCNSTARHQKAHQALKKAFEDQVLSFGMSHCKVSCNSSTCSFSKYAGIASLIVQKPVCHSLKVWHQSVVIAQVWVQILYGRGMSHPPFAPVFYLTSPRDAAISFHRL